MGEGGLVGVDVDEIVGVGEGGSVGESEGG